MSDKDMELIAQLLYFFDNHEMLDPPSAGQWSMRRGEIPYAFIELLNGDLSFDVPETRAQVIELLEAFLEPWDELSWPKEGMSPEFIRRQAAASKLALIQEVDRVRWAMVKMSRYSKPSRIADVADHTRKMLELAQATRAVENDQKGQNRALNTSDPELYLYAGVACECAAKSKKNHKKAEMILKDGLMHTKCRTVQYCSRECQTEDWAAHKKHCMSLVALGQKLEEVSLVKETRNELSMFDELTEWCNLMREPVTQACLSAFSLNKDKSRIKTHILVVQVHWNSAAKKPINFYKVHSAALVSNADLQVAHPGMPAQMDRAVASQPPMQLETTYVRVLVLGSKGGKQDTLKGYHVVMLPSYGQPQILKARHDPKWLQTLATKKTESDTYF